MRSFVTSLVLLYFLSQASVAHAEGLPRKAALGLAYGAVAQELQHKLALAADIGVFAQKPLPGQSAEKAGMKAGDVILAIDGRSVNPQTFAKVLSGVPTGTRARFDIVRDGKKRTLPVVMLEKQRDPGTADYTVEYSDVVSNGHRMRTLISHPRAPGKHPALFFIQGYSPVSYDYKLDSPGLDAPILYEFAKSGYVTPRVDKPGVGDSEGGPFADVDFTTSRRSR